MPIACPACNKADQTGAVCQRCGCELGLLHEVVSAARSLLGASVVALEGRDWTNALDCAERSWRLKHSGEAAWVAFVAAIASGDADQAACWRRRARGASPCLGR